MLWVHKPKPTVLGLDIKEHKQDEAVKNGGSRLCVGYCLLYIRFNRSARLSWQGSRFAVSALTEQQDRGPDHADK